MKKLGFLLNLLVLAGLPARCQQQSPPASFHAGPVYTSSDGKNGPEFPAFDVVVGLDPAWNHAALQASDWSETEPGSGASVQATSVRSFQQTGYGVAVILALDASGSMRGKTLARIRNSVAKFVDDAAEQDRVSVMTFADEVRWDVPFTAGHEQVRSALDKLDARGHETHLYDALIAAVNQFDDTMPKRRVVIVMSDGHDEGSRHSLEDVVSTAAAQHIAIQSIGLTRSEPRYLAVLQEISQRTGGNYAAARSDDELDALLANGVSALKQAPVVKFIAGDASAGPRTVPLVIMWKPHAVTATVDLVIPAGAGDDRKKQKYAIAGGVALLLLALLLTVLLNFWKRKKRAGREPVESAPIPAKQPALPAVGLERSGENTPSEAAGAVRTPVRGTRMVHLFEAAPGRPYAVIAALSGPSSGLRVPVSSSPFTMGAAVDNALVIANDPTLSGHHAVLRLEGSILMLDDLGSTNGTYVHGRRLSGERQSLAPGDEFRIGRTTFRVERSVDL